MTSRERDRRLMGEAIARARRGLGRTSPNPPVGCVIASGEAILAVGHHSRAGAAHAEIEAIARLPSGLDLAELEAFVTLEPCCVWGRTPPCTRALIEAGIKKVAVGSIDPDPRVHGRGVAELERAGVQVRVGVERAACDRLVAPFAKRVRRGLPWVTAKWAASLDGKIATRSGDSAWISSESSRAIVHRMRDEHDAVLVGSGTLLADDPRLTCRIEGGRDPWRFALDRALSIPLTHQMARAETSGGRTTLLTALDPRSERARRLEGAGVEIVPIALSGEPPRLDLSEALGWMARAGITSVLVEGGGQLLGSLFEAGLVDEVAAFIAPLVIGGAEAPSPVAGRGAERIAEAIGIEGARWEIVGDDALLRGTVRGAVGGAHGA